MPNSYLYSTIFGRSEYIDCNCYRNARVNELVWVCITSMHWADVSFLVHSICRAPLH